MTPVRGTTRKAWTWERWSSFTGRAAYHALSLAPPSSPPKRFSPSPRKRWEGDDTRRPDPTPSAKHNRRDVTTFLPHGPKAPRGHHRLRLRRPVLRSRAEGGAGRGHDRRPAQPRSEERRVGKECRSRWAPE